MGKLAIVPKQQRLEPEIASRSYDRIPPGEYSAFCRSVSVYRDSAWRRWLCASQWDIVDVSRTNTLAQLTKFFNLGESKNPKATSRRSNYWRAWVDANGGRPPTRGQKMSPNIFLRRFARVTVIDVEKDFNGHALSGAEVYSVISRIVTWETG